jgi:hypothetical protein
VRSRPLNRNYQRDSQFRLRGEDGGPSRRGPGCTTWMWKDSAEEERTTAAQLGNRRVSVEPGSSREAAADDSPGWSRRRNPGLKTCSAPQSPVRAREWQGFRRPCRASCLDDLVTQGYAYGSTLGYCAPPLRGWDPVPRSPTGSQVVLLQSFPPPLNPSTSMSRTLRLGVHDLDVEPATGSEENRRNLSALCC